MDMKFDAIEDVIAAIGRGAFDFGNDKVYSPVNFEKSSVLEIAFGEQDYKLNLQ